MKRYLLSISLMLCLFLAACGGSPAPTPALPNSNPSLPNSNPASSSPTVSPTGPTVLHITRSDLSTTNNLGPLDKTVTDTQVIQKLYQAALALPALSTGQEMNQACLNDVGVIYHLDFLQGSAEVRKMNLDPGNCKILYLSQTDLRQVNDAFLNLVKQTLQVSSLTSN